MLKIIIDDLNIELATGNRYEHETVPKYFLKFPDHVVATVYRSGIIKSVGDVELATLRTLGGFFVTMETDVRTGGYTTLQPSKEQMEQFMGKMNDLLAIKNALSAGRIISIHRFEQFDYEPDVPTDEEILEFFHRLKGFAELDLISRRLNRQLGLVDVVHPAIGDLDYLVFSVACGCEGGCTKCNFKHRRGLETRSEEDLHSQIDLYKEIFSLNERSGFEIFAGNHRGLGIDFELFYRHIENIRHDAGMGEGRVFAFCNAEDILRLHEQYGLEDMERRMMVMDLHPNFGVESGSLKGLQEYGKRTSLSTIKKVLTLLKGTKIPHSVNILTGVEWEGHTWETIRLFRTLYRPADNRPTVYSSDFIDQNGQVDRPLAARQFKMFRNALNDCGIFVYRYNFVPFNS